MRVPASYQGGIMHQSIMHENCIRGKSYMIDIEGRYFEARFKGYPDGDQYHPVFEICDDHGDVKVIEECSSK